MQSRRTFQWLCAAALALAASTALAAPQTTPAKPLIPARPHPLTHFRPLKKHPIIALSFDDLPAAGDLSPGLTRVKILTRLTTELRAAHIEHVDGNVNAVDIPGDPDCQQALRDWRAAGMNIGNHTFSHPALDDVTAADFNANIAQDEPYLRQYAGKSNWHWFRYPYLEEGNTLAKHLAVRRWLHRHHYRVEEVTLNFNDDDWSDPYTRCSAQHNTAAIAWLEQSYMQNAAEYIQLERQEQQVAFGHEIPNVLLLHATDFTTLMLPRLITFLKQQGFRFSTVPKVERNRAYHYDPAVGLPGGGSFTTMVLLARHRTVYLPPHPHEPLDKLNSLCGGN
jgi:peptidoglycan/xylan/chitin deacetylase (PgdA/CDA1 family)